MNVDSAIQQDEIIEIVQSIRHIREVIETDAVPVYKIKINYKSGQSHTFWATEFNSSGGKYTWNTIDPHNDVLLLGVDDIESIFQVGVAFIEKEIFDELKNE